MKVLNATQTELKETDASERTMTYLDLAKVCLNEPPERGFTPDEMRARMRVLNAIEAAETQDSGCVILEDSDAAKVQACASAMRWPRMHRQIVEFLDAVASMSAPDVKVAAQTE